MTTVGVLLAAGGGTRFTGSTHKLLAPFNGRPLFRWALDHLLAAEFDEAIVVTGGVALPTTGLAVTVIDNPEWQAGQAGSLQRALAAAARGDAEFVVVGLADQPFVPSAAWRAVRDSPSPAPIVVATYQGVRGPAPVRLHHSIWPLLPTAGDEGARSLLRLRPDWVDEVACDGSSADIDTLEDLDQWTN
jgi:molybdenum cofactor cytidylyltransferase